MNGWKNLKTTVEEAATDIPVVTPAVQLVVARLRMIAWSEPRNRATRLSAIAVLRGCVDTLQRMGQVGGGVLWSPYTGINDKLFHHSETITRAIEGYN